MDNFWKNAEQMFQINSKRTIWGGYAISFICITNALRVVGSILWQHQYFSTKSIECITLSSVIGIIGFIFCFFRKSAPIRVKYYMACLLLTSFCAYLFILHPNYVTRRHSIPEINHAILLAGIIFFGGGGLWILYNDCKWYFKKHKKNNKH